MSENVKRLEFKNTHQNITATYAVVYDPNLKAIWVEDAKGTPLILMSSTLKDARSVIGCWISDTFNRKTLNRFVSWIDDAQLECQEAEKNRPESSVKEKIKQIDYSMYFWDQSDTYKVVQPALKDINTEINKLRKLTDEKAAQFVIKWVRENLDTENPE